MREPRSGAQEPIRLSTLPTAPTAQFETVGFGFFPLGRCHGAELLKLFLHPGSPGNPGALNLPLDVFGLVVLH